MITVPKLAYVINEKEVQEKASKLLTIINLSNEEFIEQYDGMRYRIRPRSIMPVQADRVWLWFGDPRERDPKTGGGVKEWNLEVRRVQDRNEKAWLAKKSGKLHVKKCEDWPFEAGGGFYDMVDETELPLMESTPIDESLPLDVATLMEEEPEQPIKRNKK